MSDYRYQPLTDQWVLVAENREQRPNDYRPRAEYQPDRPCPFCVGHEPATPEALAFYPGSNLGEWLVRVVPNKFPALTSASTGPRESRGPYEKFIGFGIHELIVLSPRHIESFSDLNAAERHTTLIAFQDRVRLAWSWPEIRATVLFQNCRSDAGASIQHVHCQHIATSVIPPELLRKWERQELSRKQCGRTLLESIVEFETREQRRVVFENDGLVAFCPFASRLPYEIWIAPQRAKEQPAFETLSSSQLHCLADAIHSCIDRLERSLPSAAYNIVIHVPPRVDATADHLPGHWMVEIFPRLNKTAGFEWATGCMINQVSPESAAERLREPLLGRR